MRTVPEILILRILVGTTLILVGYRTFVLHPELKELKRKIQLPEFHGTAHQKTIQFAVDRLQRRSVQLRWAIFTGGLLSLGLLPWLLKF